MVVNSEMKICCAQRFHIISCASQGKTQNETFRLLQEVYGTESLSRSTCRRWYLRVKLGDKSGEDLSCPGRCSTARTLANVRAVDEVVQCDRCATICQVAAEVNLSKGSVHSILRDDLQMKKKAPKFVPHMLTQAQKDLCVEVCRQNLKEMKANPNLLASVITGDESWFSVLEPEQKQQSLQWTEKDACRPKKALRSHQARKTMMEVFFDQDGIVHLEFLPPKMIVTAKVYIGILARLREAIRRKRPKLWEQNSFQLLHDNAPAHTATPTFAAMVETSMKVLQHPPYSPDLVPADFWFFPYLKAQIRGKIFRSIPDLQDTLMVEISKIPRELFRRCLHERLPYRWRKCLAAAGEYFEGDQLDIPSDPELLGEETDESDASSER